MKDYVRPMMESEAFAANEYIAACGDSGVTYKFECNANSDGWFSNGGLVYVENGKEEGLQMLGSNRDDFLSNYTPCSETHVAESDDEFLNGYIFSLGGNWVTPVIIWRGPNNDNTHCTTELDMNEWETLKS